ncbi:MAG: aminotransferase class I/II-fold pyridoxal phosphate-dependent enzyme [Candidatus Gracilibacteria bacterium]
MSYNSHNLFTLKIQINSTLATIPPSGIRKFFEIVAEQPDVISLSVGEPDFATPWHICESAIATLEMGNTHYTGNRGTPELRAAIAKYLAAKFALRYSAKEEILVTNGGSEAFDIAARAILNPGDEVLVLQPGYVMYSPLITLAGGIPVGVNFGKDWKLSIANLAAKITPKTRAVVINYPNNPTGNTFTQAELKALAAFVKKHNLVVFSDEIYAELVYTGKHTAFASLPGMKSHTLTISGFSKAFAMTGFRLGYLAAPAEVIAAATKIHQYAALCANTVSQAAALEALQNGEKEMEKMREEYQLRRDFVVRELKQMGFAINLPAGAFYAFPEVKTKTGLSGEEFALKLLKEEKVAVVPGNAFGEEFSSYIRISYATGFSELEEAFRRIAKFIKSLKK